MNNDALSEFEMATRVEQAQLVQTMSEPSTRMVLAHAVFGYKSGWRDQALGYDGVDGDNTFGKRNAWFDAWFSLNGAEYIFRKLTALSAMSWVEHAMPVLSAPHKTAAALMCTAVDGRSGVVFKEPWPVFVLRVPDGLCGAAVFVLCTQAFPVGELYQGERNLTVVEDIDGKARVTTLRLDADTCETIEPISHDGVAVTDPVVLRTVKLCAAYFVNICVACSNHKPTPMGKHDGRVRAARMEQLPIVPVRPRCLEFVYGRAVQVDCREHVRQYVAGTVSRLKSVRHLVRGHWRNVPHGTQRALRKLQWIEPYWQGDPFAPTLVRPHVVTKTPDECMAWPAKAGPGLER